MGTKIMATEQELLTVEELAKLTYVETDVLASWLGLNGYYLGMKVSYKSTLRWFFSCIELAREANNEMLAGDITDNKNSWLLRVYSY